MESDEPSLHMTGRIRLFQADTYSVLMELSMVTWAEELRDSGPDTIVSGDVAAALEAGSPIAIIREVREAIQQAPADSREHLEQALGAAVRGWQSGGEGQYWWAACILALADLPRPYTFVVAALCDAITDIAQGRGRAAAFVLTHLIPGESVARIELAVASGEIQDVARLNEP